MIDRHTQFKGYLLAVILSRREKQTTNQLELIRRTGALHDKIVGFLESFTTVGFEINQASEAYNKARGQLITGTGNVIRQTEQLADLGAKVKKQLREKSGLRTLAEEAEQSALLDASGYEIEEKSEASISLDSKNDFIAEDA